MSNQKTSLESDSPEEEIAAAVAKLSKAGEKVEFVEKPGVLVEKWMEAKSEYEDLLINIDSRKKAANEIADQLAMHYGIKVTRIGSTETVYATEENPIAYTPVRTMSVEEIRAESTYSEVPQSEESFAAQISSGIEMAFAGIR